MDFLSDIKSKIDELKVISFSEKAYDIDSNFIELRKGVYELNNNKTIEREIVVKKAGVGNASAIFAVTDDNKILLVIQPRVSLNTKDKINVELPAGYIEKGEDAMMSGIRELEEETGYTTDKIIVADEYKSYHFCFLSEKYGIPAYEGILFNNSSNLCGKSSFPSYVLNWITSAKYFGFNSLILEINWSAKGETLSFKQMFFGKAMFLIKTSPFSSLIFSSSVNFWLKGEANKNDEQTNIFNKIIKIFFI